MQINKYIQNNINKNISQIIQTKKPKFEYFSLESLKTCHIDTKRTKKEIKKGALPRFLYHLTSFENFTNILKTGWLDISKTSWPRGIYMIELENFGKFWSDRLKLALCKKTSRINKNQSGNLVVLKIPTQKLKTDKLKIRTQKDIKELSDDAEIRVAFFKGLLISNYTKEQLKNEINIDKKFREYIDNDIPVNLKKILKGIDAKYTPLYKQKKADLEFIYEDKIPITDVFFIGTTNIKPELEKNKSNKITLLDTAKQIFLNIFKNQPESNGIKKW